MDRGRDYVRAGNEDEPGDVCRSNRVVLEREAERDVSRADRYLLRRVEEMGVDCPGGVSTSPDPGACDARSPLICKYSEKPWKTSRSLTVAGCALSPWKNK